MTAPLRDLLDEAAAAAPVARVDVAAAWAGGRRDRRARRWGGLGVAAALLAAFALVVPLAPTVVPGYARDAAVSGYPARLDRQLWVRDLPERPGPLAGLVQVIERLDTHDELRGWQGLRADGHRWWVSRESLAEPTLSPDGRLLGRLVGGLTGPFVVTDLGTGADVVFEDVGVNVDPAPRPHVVSAQTPYHWSPDARRVITGNQAVGATGSGVLVMDVDAGTSRVFAAEGLPAGWLDDDRLVTVSDGRSPTDASDPTGDVVARTYRVGTGALGSTVVLRPDAELGPLARLDQRTGLVTADRRELVLVGQDAFDANYGTAGVRRFDLATGRETTPGPPAPLELSTTCGPTAVAGGGAVALPVDDGDLLRVVQVERDGSTRTVVRRPAEDERGCIALAAGALAGEPRTPLLPWWSPLAGLVLAVGALGVLVRSRRRRPVA